VVGYGTKGRVNEALERVKELPNSSPLGGSLGPPGGRFFGRHERRDKIRTVATEIDGLGFGFGPPRVKICCISSVSEAWTAIRNGASALGLVSEMPSGPGVIPEELIAEIARLVPPGVSSFLLTSRQDVASIVAQHRRTKVDTLQLVDRLPRGAHRELREALPGIRLVQVVHVEGPEAVDEALSVTSEVDALLLDSGRPSLPVKELGGTGRRHDWTLSRRIRDAVGIPVFLAGGLTPDNVRQAVEEVVPYGLDVCSGVRADGRLDAGKVALFIERARSV
jgi:phosphoribosylanthranilate isomerase